MAVRHPEAAPGGSTDGQVIPSRDPVADAIDVVLFCFTEKWWDWERDGFVQRTACLAERLAADPRVRGLLVVNAPSSIFAAVAKDRPAGAGLREARPGVFVLDHVRLLPRERHNSWAMIVNGVLHDRAFKRRLGEAISTLGMRDPIIWLSGPTVARYASVFPESTVVYDAVDDCLARGPCLRSLPGAGRTVRGPPTGGPHHRKRSGSRALRGHHRCSGRHGLHSCASYRLRGMSPGSRGRPAVRIDGQVPHRGQSRAHRPGGRCQALRGTQGAPKRVPTRRSVGRRGSSVSGGVRRLRYPARRLHLDPLHGPDEVVRVHSRGQARRHDAARVDRRASDACSFSLGCRTLRRARQRSY
jgi:hypothetical protein